MTLRDLDGEEARKHLTRIEQEQASSVEADVTAQGVEAELSTTKHGWQIAGYFKRLWKGDTTVGARVKKDF